MCRLDAGERNFLTSLLLGELRQGALRALVVEALSSRLHVPLDRLRRAIMFSGNFGAVVESVARGGDAELNRFTLKPLIAIEPMLAAGSTSIEDAVDDMLPAAVEWKLDGMRIQLHRRHEDVRVFSRQLRDVTALLPEVVELASSLGGREFILDGEVIGVNESGRPVPFQDLMAFVSRENKTAAKKQPELIPLFFDVLYADGTALVDEPLRHRREALERLVPAKHLVAQLIAQTNTQVTLVYEQALAAGHEGIVLKSMDAPYTAGRRGRQWRKVKPAVTLDLVILAAEWGSGRRTGFLSNLHLGARVPDEPGRFLMLGKTFKGLTDAMLRELTIELPKIEIRREDRAVYVEPKRVVEIAFDKLQRSRRYDSGMALRFARVKRFRPDKKAIDASTIDEVRHIFERQHRGGAQKK
jgi:DNA ligase-1